MPVLTAGAIVTRIKEALTAQGVAWNDTSTRDRYTFGGPDAAVTGIATTFMGTFEARCLSSTSAAEERTGHRPDRTRAPDPQGTAASCALPILVETELAED